MMPPLLLANLFSTYGLAAALAIICLVVLRGNWFRQRRSKESEADPSEIKKACAPKARETAFENAPNDLLRWQVEMHEMARDIKGEIDAKMLALQSLMIVAREHCQRLESLLQHAEQHGDRQSPEFVGGRETLERIEAAEGNVPPLPVPPHGNNVLSPAQADRAKRLAKQEWSPQQIAREIGATLGDVELFLSLHQEILSN
ncbi:hypothetical protein ETAA8_51850 [Anatilimnocola aggregata]|uniref:Uncharacterized protein n=1 Tax=Anatilimnocola aggregata TaxID=2528021 RepID=A0A517YIM8_9BACT|nr:hypothetical protein [Anatilimnocola aggregata]QDU30066.1 hypothetical protein ETAA8_51850 [Anatilimnocola aggregata]